MSNLPDKSLENALIAQAIQGDSDAFGALYDLYVQAIYTFVYYQVSNQHEAEDLTEIVFMKAFEKLPEFRKNKRMDNFRAWIYRIARNLVIDQYRTRKQVVSLDYDMPLPSKERALDHQIEIKEDVAAVMKALSNLDDLFREVITLRLVNGLSYAETAHAMGITKNYVRVLQFRGLKKLREMLDVK